MTDSRDPSNHPQSSDSPPEGLQRSGHRKALRPEEVAAMEAKIRNVEIAISLVLRIGVILSVAVITVGLGLMFVHHSAYRPIHGNYSYRGLTSPSTQFPHSFSSLGHSIAHGKGQGIVVLGVLILILTPVLRVAVGVLSFLYEKDTPMALITLYVLVVLIGSFFLAGV